MDAQFLWPPSDPTRLVAPSFPATTSAFIYGNDSFNPNLRPSSSTLRRREGTRDSHRDSNEMFSDGESSSSSPERYLSDYDEDDVGPLPRGQRLERIRQGSEGWEVRPGPVWAANDDLEIGSSAPWLDQGRYNYYDTGDIDPDGHSLDGTKQDDAARAVS